MSVFVTESSDLAVKQKRRCTRRAGILNRRIGSECARVSQSVSPSTGNKSPLTPNARATPGEGGLVRPAPKPPGRPRKSGFAISVQSAVAQEALPRESRGGLGERRRAAPNSCGLYGAAVPLQRSAKPLRRLSRPARQGTDSSRFHWIERLPLALRRAFIAVAVFLLVCSFNPPASAADTAPGADKLAPPNIVVFIGDDIDWRTYGCYGDKGIRTPNIDALATGGLKFTRAFLTTSSCSPSRISILTGKYPHATGAEDLHMPLPKDELFVTTYLKRGKGYFNGHMRKTHYGAQGMRQFDWYSKNIDDFGKFVDAAGDTPFFMWVGFSDAHRPYRPGAVDPPHDPAKVTVPPYLVDTPETRADLALYYDEISRMDLNIGKMVAALKKRNKFNNTLIVFIGDNGMPFPGAKGTVYDSGIGTPMVVSWPKVIKGGQVHTGMASVIDLAPTFLDAAGLDVPSDMQGQSMLPVLKDPTRSGRAAVFGERNWHNCDEHIRCVRTARYKLIRNAYIDKPYGNPADTSSCPSWKSLLEAKAAGKLTPAQQRTLQVPRPAVEFYDLKRDPHETKNLANDPNYATQQRELDAMLDAWIKGTKDFPPTRRTRADNTNRTTGVKFTRKIGPLENP